MGRSKRAEDSMFKHTAFTNKKSFGQYYTRLTELSVAMFDWKNLPETVDPRFLELCLFADGMSVFFKDDVLGFLALRCMAGGPMTVYNIPTMREAYGDNGYHLKLTPENSVIIFNNFLHTNSMLDVEQFAERLYNLDRTIDVNVNAQKTPVLIQCDENQRLTMKQLYMKYEGNEPFIFGDKSLKPETMRVMKTDAPFLADKLYTLKIQIWNEALTYLGISNVNFSKKERLISDEVTRQQGGIIANRYSRLETRRQACREINRMFGLNVECDYREDFREIEQDVVLTGQSGSGEAVRLVKTMGGESE